MLAAELKAGVGDVVTEVRALLNEFLSARVTANLKAAGTAGVDKEAVSRTRAC